MDDVLIKGTGGGKLEGVGGIQDVVAVFFHGLEPKSEEPASVVPILGAGRCIPGPVDRRHWAGAQPSAIYRWMPMLFPSSSVLRGRRSCLQCLRRRNLCTQVRRRG